MKKRTFFTVLAASLTFASAVGLTACEEKDNKSDEYTGEGGGKKAVDSWARLVNEDSKPASVNGNTMTYGSHTYTMEGTMDDTYAAGATGKVTFTNVPSGYTEFKAVYEQFLGKTPYGTAAMLPMAFEIWARNNATGERCLDLLCYSICKTEVLRELSRHIVTSEYSPDNDSYVQRCMTAATLSGATKENGYNPTEPYTINMEIGQENTWKAESEVLQAYVYTLYVVADGNAWSTNKRSVTVQRGWNDNLYKANNCPSLYVNIFTPRTSWNGLK